MAVGDEQNGGALSEIWRGRRWTRETVRSSPRASTLESISCTSERFCVAVGGTALDQPLIEAWNGRRWSRMVSPGASGGSAPLEGVSCSSQYSCVAVGTAFSGRGQSGRVERYGDGSWRVVHTDISGELPTLTAVSCPASGWCVAVGTVEAASTKTPEPLALEITGGGVSQLNVVTAPTAGFSGVSCPEVDSCVAVGGIEASEQPAEGGTGPSGGSTGVSGGSTGASGGSTGATGVVSANALAPFAESLGDGLWQLTLPASEGSSDTLDGGVSCTTSSSCQAVGYHVASSGGHISASADELSDIAWTTLQTPSNPS
jgi:hypothetical protein